MHEAAFRALDLTDWRYQKLPVPPELLAETLEALPRSGFVGANVTVPHKELALVLADEASETAAGVGAANTLTFRADGTFHADNTDVGGLIASLPIPVEGRRALVLGAGGSARAAVYGLVAAGADDVSVVNRTHERAVELADAMDARASRTADAADVLVNCTSVGLDDSDALPVDERVLDQVGAVVDLVYRPGGTRLVRAARERGLPCTDGLEILVQQGARSFAIWTGREAPVDVMRAAVAD
jgi:shikimate dehydrogenase